MYGAKAQIALLEKALTVNLVMVPFTTDHRYEPKHPEVLRINPKRQVPVLVHGEVEIFDSTQIFEYLEHLQPRPPLWPETPASRAHARLLELKSDEVFFPLVIRLMGLQDRLSEAGAREAISQLHRLYAEWDAVLGDRDYLAGEFSYADIALFMAQLFAARLGAPMNDETPRLIQWRMRVAARPAVRTVVVQFVDTLTRLKLAVPQFMTDGNSRHP
jgi:glutathione S-transferase